MDMYNENLVKLVVTRTRTITQNLVKLVARGHTAIVHQHVFYDW